MKLVIRIYHDVTNILGIQNVVLLSNFPFGIIIVQLSLQLTDLKRPEISLKGKVIIRVSIDSFACGFDNISLCSFWLSKVWYARFEC